MADEADKTVDKAAAAVGAGQEDLNPSEVGGGNPAPKEAPNEPPAKEPTAEEKAAAAEAEKAAADAAAKEAEDKPLDVDVWGTTGDEVGDSVLNLLQNGGLNPEDAKALMYDAMQAGDVTKIDRNALVEKVGKAKATLILAGAESYLNNIKAKAETILTEVHTAVGGKDNWDAVTTWAKTNVSADELAEYRDLIDAGGAKARFAATELVGRFNGNEGNTTLNAGAEVLGDTKASPSSRQLSKADYFAELEAAHSKGASEAVINEINAARARGRAAGI